MQPIVSIIMGSDSDLPVMQEAAKVLEMLQIPFNLTIVSAHRTPDRMVTFAKEAVKNGIKVIIAGAGGAAHLPGMVASLTPLPVIGVPIKGKTLDGLDSLYSIVQMPPGIPVATVAINGAKNAGILAGSIIGITDKGVQDRVKAYKESLEAMVMEKVARIEDMGFVNYLETMN